MHLWIEVWYQAQTMQGLTSFVGGIRQLISTETVIVVNLKAQWSLQKVLQRFKHPLTTSIDYGQMQSYLKSESMVADQNCRIQSWCTISSRFSKSYCWERVKLFGSLVTSDFKMYVIVALKLSFISFPGIYGVWIFTTAMERREAFWEA